MHASASTTSSAASCALGCTTTRSAAGSSHASGGSRSAPAAIWRPVTASAGLDPIARLLSELKMPASSADTAPTAMPVRMPAGVPPTTSATPGSTARLIPTSARCGRRRASDGSMIDTNTGVSAMHVAATEAFDSLIEP